MRVPEPSADGHSGSQPYGYPLCPTCGTGQVKLQGRPEPVCINRLCGVADPKIELTPTVLQAALRHLLEVHGNVLDAETVEQHLRRGCRDLAAAAAAMRALERVSTDQLWGFYRTMVEVVPRMFDISESRDNAAIAQLRGFVDYVESPAFSALSLVDREDHAVLDSIDVIGSDSTHFAVGLWRRFARASYYYRREEGYLRSALLWTTADAAREIAVALESEPNLVDVFIERIAGVE